MQDGKTEDIVAKDDAGKLRLTLVPRQIIYAIAEIREYGCRKYPHGGVDNWKTVEPDRYFDALARHILAAWNDHTAKDPESGYMHLKHAACNLAFLLELIEGDDNNGYSEKNWTGRPSAQETAGIHGIEGDGAYKAHTVLYGADEA